MIYTMTNYREIKQELSKINSHYNDYDEKNYTFLKNHYNIVKNNKRLDKNILRKEALQKRELMSKEEINKISDIIFEKIKNNQTFINASQIFCYLSYKNEIKTDKIIDYALEKNKSILIPHITGNEMISVQYNKDIEMTVNKYGIKEPVSIIKQDISKIDLVIVPGLIFNELGFRIGYGGGYYDKFLENCDAFSIGLCMNSFINNSFIPDYYDKPVDEIILG